MAQFLAILLLIVVLGFIGNHWESILYVIGIVIGCLLLFGIFFALLHRHSEKEKKKSDEVERELLRLEPLREGETIEQRVKTRFLQTCQPEFDRLANMRVRKIEAWKIELDNLISSRLLPILDMQQRDHVRQMQRKSDNVFEEPIRILAVEKEQQAKVLAKKRAADVRSRYHPSSMTPLEFEHWCRDMLMQQGWTANVVGGSGDQGADVIATKENSTLVLQCKYYGSPVGNAAVQEVHAARSFYRASHAAVVTNANYTKGGVALADRTNVRLLSAQELMEVARYL